VAGLININNMKAKFLKIAGVKSEKEFYKKYPTEAAFFKAHPEAKKQIKKAEVGSYIGGEQDAVADYQSYQDYANLVPLRITGQTQEQMGAQQENQDSGGIMNALQGIASGLGNMGGLKPVGLGTTKGSDPLGLKKGAMSGVPTKATKLTSLSIPGAKKGKNVKKAQGGAAGILSGAGGQKPNIMGGITQGLPLIGDIAGAIGSIGQMKKQRKELETAAKISDVALQASRTQPERTARRYVRPEDAVVSPNERFIPGGTGTEILAEYGASIGGNPTEIQNMYNPGDLYSDLGYEPLSDSDIIKQYRSGGYIPQAKGGMNFGNFMSGGGGQAVSSLIGAGFSQAGGGAGAGSQIGGALGQGVGMFLGPVGSAIAQPIGQLLGGGIGALVDAKGAKQQKRNEEKLKRNTETMALQDSVRGAIGNYSSFVKNGGDIPYAEHGWVSHDWQPQVIAKWGDVNVQDVDGIFRPDDMKTLEHGGLLKAQGGMQLPYENFEQRVNWFRDVMGKYPDEELNKRATTEAGLAEYARLHPNDPFTKEDIAIFQDYTTQVLDPQTKAFMQRRGKEDWKPGTQRSKRDAIWGPKTQKQPFANLLMKKVGDSEFTDLGTVREGFATSGTDGGGSSSMRGLIPGKIRIGGKSINIERKSDGKSYFRNPSTGDLSIYDPKRYHEETGEYYRTGGNIRQNNMSELDQFNFGGSLKTHWGGKAEVDSYNPYLPGTGETVMFKGNQHSESDGTGKTGIGVSYGPKEHDSYTDYAEYGSEQAADVEVENGEPATQLPDANGDLSMTVFGALKIDKNAAMEIGDDEAKGLTYKKYVDRLNDKENKANKKLAKANEELEDLKVNTPFDRLKLNSLQSIIQGSDQELQRLAALKTSAAGVQNAYNETADELGLDADALAKGKVKAAKSSDMAKYGKQLEKAQRGTITGSPRLDSLVTSAGIFPLPPVETEYTSSVGSDGKKSSPSSKKKTASGKKSTTSKKSYTPPKTPLVLQSQTNPIPPKVTANFDWAGINKNKMEEEVIPYYDAPFSSEYIKTKLEDILKDSKKLKKRKSVDGGFKADRPTGTGRGSAPGPGKKEDKKEKTDWQDLAKALSTQLGPLLRRPLQEDLRGDQLYGEMIAKAQNQLEPVQAQTFQPLLDQPYQVSFQDQLNQNQASFNALLRTPGVANNPAAQSALAAQKYEADRNILANQFRTNQAIVAETINKNRGILNDAQLKNLTILDQQYARQAEAISKTKATDLEIAKSISDKIAKNRLENRTFAAYSNMFPQYGFNRNMMAVSQLPTFFNTGSVPGLSPEDAKEFQEWYNQKNKAKTASTTTGKYGKELKKHFKNGNIVKSFKG
jgi:hypothetical protein